MGKGIRLVDSARETAKEVQRVLTNKNLKRQDDSPVQYGIFVSNNPEKFIQVGEGFLKRPINPISIIDPEK